MFNPNVVVKNIFTAPGVQAVVSLVARVLLAYIFLVSGWGKITGYAGTQGYMEMMGVSGSLLPLVILVEFGGALALIFGFQARFAAFGLAVFSIVSAVLFHQGGATPADIMNNSIHFMKNISMAGGFLFLVLQGAGQFSIDAAIEK